MQDKQALYSDKHWPLIKLKIPGGQDALVKGLLLPTSTGIPFQIIVKGTNVKITPGVIAGFVPTNINTTFAYGGSDMYFWAECNSLNFQFTSVRIQSGSIPPTPQEITENAPATLLNIPIGMILSKKCYNLIAANWVNPYPVLAYSIGPANNPIRYYYWVW